MEIIFFIFKKKIATNHSINIGTLSDYTKSIEVYVKHQHSSFTCFTSTYLLGKSLKNKDLKDAIKSADISIPNGVFLRKNLKLRHGLNIRQTNNYDLANNLIKVISEENVCVVNSHEGVSDSLLVDRPKIKTLLYDPDNTKMIKKINAINRPLLIVNLPEEEQIIWMSQMKGKINSTMIGIGKTDAKALKRFQYSLAFLKKLWF